MEGNNNFKLTKDGKTSVQRLVLTIVLILIVILGLYYTYQYYIKKSPNDNTNNTPKLEEGWNGIYKNDTNTNQVLLYTSNGTTASLILAKTLVIPDAKPIIMYPMQNAGGLTIKDGKMSFVQDAKPVYSITKNGDKIVITYDGDPAAKDSYNELVGTFTKTKNVTSFDTKEFE